MTKRTLICIAAAISSAMAASAQTTDVTLDLDHVLNIKADICASNETVIFLPVSHDVETDAQLYAVVSLANPEANAVEIVTSRERQWLASNSCSTRQDDMDVKLAQTKSVERNF